MGRFAPFSKKGEGAKRGGAKLTFLFMDQIEQNIGESV